MHVQYHVIRCLALQRSATRRPKRRCERAPQQIRIVQLRDNTTLSRFTSLHASLCVFWISLPRSSTIFSTSQGLPAWKALFCRARPCMDAQQLRSKTTIHYADNGVTQLTIAFLAGVTYWPY